MNSASFGDMAHHLLLRRKSASLKAKLPVLSHEMTTGKFKDKALKLNGQLGILAGLEKSLSRAKTHASTAQSVTQFLNQQELVIKELTTLATDSMSGMAPVMQNGSERDVTRVLSDAGDVFASAISVINTRFAGRSIFSGIATTQAAIAPSEQILDLLFSEVTMPTSVFAISDIVDEWFSPGGGFDAAGYLGSSQSPAPVHIGSGRFVKNDVTAQDTAIRVALAAFAKPALFGKLNINHPSPNAHAGLQEAYFSLLSSERALIELGARIGSNQEKALTGLLRAETEKTSLSLARAELIASDPYEAASKFENAITLIDTVYALTARASRLTLSDYLK